MKQTGPVCFTPRPRLLHQGPCLLHPGPRLLHQGPRLPRSGTILGPSLFPGPPKDPGAGPGPVRRTLVSQGSQNRPKGPLIRPRGSRNRLRGSKAPKPTPGTSAPNPKIRQGTSGLVPAGPVWPPGLVQRDRGTGPGDLGTSKSQGTPEPAPGTSEQAPQNPETSELDLGTGPGDLGTGPRDTGDEPVQGPWRPS